MRLAILPLLTCCLLVGAEDGILATWDAGPGTLAGAEARSGTAISAGTPVSAGTKVARIALAGAPGSLVYLAPGSRLRLEGASGSLRILLEAGTVQVSIADKGAWKDIHVVGAALDVAVTGTLFVVERGQADTDYVALIAGKVSVSLKREVAELLGQGGSVELEGRQGLEGSAAGGLGGVDTLVARPQLGIDGAAGRGLRAQGLGNGGTAWDADSAAAAFALLAPALGPGLAAQVIEQEILQQQIREELQRRIADQVVDQAVQQAGSIGTPPPPPAGH